MSAICSVIAQAQLQKPESWSVTVPIFALAGTGQSTRPITATEATAHVQNKQIEVNTQSVSFRSGHYPIDSMRAVVVATGQAWLARLQRQAMRGIQLDALGRLSVAAQQEREAKAQIAARLATPGLSLEDKAYTLRSAIEAFSDVYAPERLPTAEAYLTQLDALGDAVAAWQFEAHKTLLWTYYLLGQSSGVIRHGTDALNRLRHITFLDRWVMYDQVSEHVYSPTVEALTGQPRAHEQIEHLNTLLRMAAIPNPAVVAADSDNYYVGRSYQSAANSLINGNAKLGTSAAPIIAHYWLNRPSHDSAILRLADKKIRIIELGNTTCAPCIEAVHALQQVHERLPDIEPILLTWTSGYWGNRLIAPSEEITYLAEYFTRDAKVTFPVGIWAGRKIANEDGGTTPERPSNFKDYLLSGKPVLYVVDGKGSIRRIFTGYDREIERQLSQTLEFLLGEAKSGTKSIASETH